MVVDIGSEIDQFALAVTAYCRRVLTVDVSDVMLDRLRVNVAHRQLANAEIVRAGFPTYVHRSGPVDLLHSR